MATLATKRRWLVTSRCAASGSPCSRQRLANMYSSCHGQKLGPILTSKFNSENSKANRIETMKGPAESGQICSVGRRKVAKKIAKNKRCYANTLRPRSRMLLKVMKGG